MTETRNRQRPVRFGELEPRSPITGLRPWLRRTRRTAPPVLAFGFAPDGPQQPPGPVDEPPLEPGLAFDVASGPEEDGQQLILKYLQGDDVPQRKADFDRGAELFRLAREIKDSNAVIAREAFFLGRAATFEGRYAYASQMLNEAIRREPDAAYAYNALESRSSWWPRPTKRSRPSEKRLSGLPTGSIPATTCSPLWRTAAIFAWLSRRYSRLFNKSPTALTCTTASGPLYQRLARRKAAEKEYRAALAISDLPEARTGMGSILAAKGKTEKAAVEFDRALQLNPDLLAARHDLALLVARSDPVKAIANWERNLRRDREFCPVAPEFGSRLPENPGPAYGMPSTITRNYSRPARR